ncbi:two-component system OmpR family sensor kinase [Kribbella sp. VKM Ac-2571]|uniref:sensor histidine kinase n=1 Tax=Kribbella sp. VKM Ac-2571 TaxID=2512222 RepID=UPI0010616363|nr:HAMP domain-containing sensor histidine kinase [Kribbella sp. VKM Ac-2571]TDO49723.1 two-component system OmpR family sensor kinase [Kribbella sp. VKM Ac-2571]
MKVAARSLSVRVAAAMVALVAVVSLVIGVLTTAAIGSYLTRQLDGKVAATQGRAVGALKNGGPPPDAPHGQDAGTVTVYTGSSTAVGEVITADGKLSELSDQAVDVLDDLADGQNKTVDLPDLGEYRVHATSVGQFTVITGLPTKDIQNTINSLIGWEALFGGIGVLTAGGVAVFVVRRQLRPLRRVAQTAREVAGLPLDTGEIGMTARVPDQLTDERTEVGQVAVALNTLLGHMENALDARHRSEQQVRQFVADASHELRTPLTTIHGYAQLSLHQSDPELFTHAMGKVMVETTRMASLVEDLLLLARLDAGRPLDSRPVDLSRLALDAVTDARIVAPGHHWELDLPAEPIIVIGDEQRLHQVVANLLTNARRHTPPGTTVTVAATSSERSALLTIHDDGPGIPADLLPNVFQRFTRADTARNRSTGGTGLGLSLAQSITQAHNGTLTLTSTPGNTTFTLTLPR